jgi:hypothetical protein
MHIIGSITWLQNRLRVRQLAKKILDKTRTLGSGVIAVDEKDEKDKESEEDPNTLEDYLNIFKRIQRFFVENIKDVMIVIAGDLEAIYRQCKVGDLANPWVDMFVECLKAPVDQLVGPKPQVHSTLLFSLTKQFCFGFVKHLLFPLHNVSI